MRLNLPLIARGMAWAGALLAALSLVWTSVYLLAFGCWLCGFGSGAAVVFALWLALWGQAQEKVE